MESAEQLDLKGFDNAQHDGLVLDNVNSWAQLLRWRAVLQARNAKSKGGQSSTNVYAYTQYLFGVPVVATLDLDTPDKHLVDTAHPERSKWLLKNCVVLQLPRGETFYDKTKLPTKVVPNCFSLFAQTLKRRRATSPAIASPFPGSPSASSGPPPDLPFAWSEEDDVEYLPDAEDDELLFQMGLSTEMD